MGKRAALLLMVAALLPATVAEARGPLPVQVGKDWKHNETKIKFPGSAAGFVLKEVVDNTDTQSDVMMQYVNADARTFATVYIHRAGLPNVSIWADRAEGSMLANQAAYGSFDRTKRRWARFTPAFGGDNAAIRLVYPVSGKSMVATGMIVAPYGTWLIKIRMSSGFLNAEQLDVKLMDFLTAMKLPKVKQDSGAAYAISDCTDAIPATGARLVERGAARPAALLTASQPLPNGRGLSYCRDKSLADNMGVYRPVGSKVSYMITPSDSGSAFFVGPEVAVPGASGASTGRTSVILVTADKAYGFQPFDGVPAPDEVLKGLGRSQPLYVRSRLPGKEREIVVAP